MGKIYVWAGPGKVVEKGEAIPKRIVSVVPDVEPHRNMATGEIVSTRRRHREILREHGCIEVGNEFDGGKNPFVASEKAAEVEYNEGLKRDLKRTYEELAGS